MSDIKVEKNKKPSRLHKGNTAMAYPFDQMKPGDSFYYEGPRSGPIISFGYRAIKGLFSTEKEETLDAHGKVVKSGWRFFMWKDPTKDQAK